MSKSVIIIGAGIAGLSAGCYGQMNGYDTRVLEMHTMPGGVCTTWTRKNFRIDGCIHWLTGSRVGSSFNNIWQELGAVQGRVFVNHEEYARIEGKDGEVLIVYADINRLEEHMKDLAPEDKDVIEEFANGIRKCLNFPMPVEKAPELFSMADRFGMMRAMLPYMRFFGTWGKITLKEYAQRFKNPFLREVFPLIVNLQNPPEFPILALFMTLAWMHKGVAGYPMGGSLEFAKAIERRYITLGGEVQYKCRVSKILVEKGCAVGVRLADGSEHHSDIIISAADGHTTIFTMLDGKFISRKIRRYYTQLPLFPSLVYVGIGVRGSFEDVPMTVTGIDYPVDEGIEIGGQERRRLSFQFYNFDPSLAPSGRTFVRVMFATDYDYWRKLYSNTERYKAEKQRVAEEVIARLDQRFPKFAENVEMVNVATPMTFVRYTGNWRGSF
ncbi:MAG: phytoene desaturase family protein, partial [Candidatus Sifarchaeia archaeon]